MTQYEVALSFAGEQRKYVDEVARMLQARGIAVFYDGFEEVRLWGMDLAEEFNRIFEADAGMVVMFISKDYVAKDWPRFERRSILSGYVSSKNEFILPVRFDDTEVPGLPGTLGYLEAIRHSHAELASMIAEKLGITPFQGKASDVPPPTSTALQGELTFDYSNYNGRYIIGRGRLVFETKWSKSSNSNIHCYNDPSSINGIALCKPAVTSIGQVSAAADFNFTSRVRKPELGQIVILRNTNGFYAAIQIVSIKDDSRGDDSDELRIRYAIQRDGSDDFTTFGTDD